MQYKIIITEEIWADFSLLWVRGKTLAYGELRKGCCSRAEPLWSEQTLSQIESKENEIQRKRAGKYTLHRAERKQDGNRDREVFISLYLFQYLWTLFRANSRHPLRSSSHKIYTDRLYFSPLCKRFFFSVRVEFIYQVCPNDESEVARWNHGNSEQKTRNEQLYSAAKGEKESFIPSIVLLCTQNANNET